jgi:hypothetical protein
VILTDAIRLCCALRGDTPEQVAALLADCRQQSFEDQADLLSHFVSEASRWLCSHAELRTECQSAEPINERP